MESKQITHTLTYTSRFTEIPSWPTQQHHLLHLSAKKKNIENKMKRRKRKDSENQTFTS